MVAERFEQLRCRARSIAAFVVYLHTVRVVIEHPDAQSFNWCTNLGEKRSCWWWRDHPIADSGAVHGVE
jgi:hypothetical protein